MEQVQGIMGMMQGPDAFQKKDIVVENDGLLADSDCDSLNNSEKPVAITSTRL